MAYDPQNVFARILRGELPCIKIYENDQVLCFMDLMPQAEGHALVVTKESAETLFDLSDAGAAACMAAARHLGPAIMTAVGAEGMLVSQFNGVAAGQTVPHVHFHLVPRWHDRPLKSHARERADQAGLEAVAQRIIAALQG